MMIKKSIFILTLFIGTTLLAQKPQRIGYIDMQYILDNIPEYVEAENRLKAKVSSWNDKLDQLSNEIEDMKNELINEKALLTENLIEERKEDIAIKELDLKNLKQAYFGPNGDLFILRKQLVKPVQDQVYNAVQEIAIAKKYDIIFDKTSDLLMLYSNNRFDISELVLGKIVKGRKIKAVEEKKEKRQEAAEKAQEKAKTKAEQRQAKRAALEEKIKLQNEARAKLREEAKRAAAEKRKKRLEEIERRKQERAEKIKKKQEEAANKEQDTTKNN